MGVIADQVGRIPIFSTQYKSYVIGINRILSEMEKLDCCRRSQFQDCSDKLHDNLFRHVSLQEFFDVFTQRVIGKEKLKLLVFPTLKVLSIRAGDIGALGGKDHIRIWNGSEGSLHQKLLQIFIHL